MTDTTTSVSYLTATLWIAIGAVIAAFVTGRAVRFVKISEHRQNWINALRDDVAEFIADAHSVQADTKDLISLSLEPAQRDELQRRINTKKDGADTLLLKIILRLNPKEDDHIELEKLLNELREGKAINAELEKRALEQARTRFQARMGRCEVRRAGRRSALAQIALAQNLGAPKNSARAESEGLTRFGQRSPACWWSHRFHCVKRRDGLAFSS